MMQISQLPNGLRVVTNLMPHLETVSLGIWVGAGARFEERYEHGISHLLEHMAFKGTPSRSAQAIAEEIEAVGGDLNAATSLETTAYYVRILKDDVELAVELVSDILQNPLFDEAELVREKDVILQEIAATQDCPDDLVYDLAQETAYPDQALGRPILGTNDSVLAITPDDLKRYMDRHYTSDQMVLAAAGAINHEALVSLAKRYFSGLKPSKDRNLAPAKYYGGATAAAKNFEQSHLILGFQGSSFHADDFYATQVFSGLLGGGMSSRLFQEVREKRGLVYAIYSFSWGLSDTGLFAIHAATGAEQLPELAHVLGKELTHAASTLPKPSELARAKAQLKAGLLMSLESSAARSEQLARQTLAFGQPVDTEELVEKVDRVTAEEVLQTAERILTNAQPTCATVGPSASSDVFKHISIG